MRKVIQISTVPETANCFPAIFALLDDGQIWVRTFSGENNWDQVAPPPPCVAAKPEIVSE